MFQPQQVSADWLIRVSVHSVELDCGSVLLSAVSLYSPSRSTGCRDFALLYEGSERTRIIFDLSSHAW